MLKTTLTIISAILATVTHAAPISVTVAAVADDFAFNVLMTSGAAQFVVWVPTDGSSHSTSSLTCLNVVASALGSCDITSIDQVAAVAGYTCGWTGANGWSSAQAATDATAWVPVSPPTTITSAWCVS